VQQTFDKILNFFGLFNLSNDVTDDGYRDLKRGQILKFRESSGNLQAYRIVFKFGGQIYMKKTDVYTPEEYEAKRMAQLAEEGRLHDGN
jgi:hypothetical protein